MPLDPQSLTGAPLNNYEEIRRAALLRIPRYTPEWTDYNESDPGITMVELFAWLTDMLLYEMKQVPARNVITFLRNLGQELRPPAAAVANLAFTAQAGVRALPIPRSTQIRAQPADGGEPLLFETTEGLDLILPPLDAVQVFDGVAFQRITLPAGGTEISFRPFGWTPQPGSALYLGFNSPQPPSPIPLFPSAMRFFVFLPPTRQAARGVDCRSVPVDAAPPAPATLVWEYRSGPPTALRWRQLDVFADGSVGFTREGAIHVQGPPLAIAPSREGSYTDVDRFWLRIRMVSGSFPAAPEIAALAPNVVAARNLATIHDEVLGRSRGTPDQVFTFARTPVYKGAKVEDQPRIRVEEPGETGIWERRDDLLGSGTEDRHYILSPVAGEIRFGDGKNGRIPKVDAQIVAVQYLYGGGARGNVAPRLITNLTANLTGVASVTNPRPASGGTEEQSPDEFLKCAPANLRHLNRAVSTEDFEALTLQLGGIAKAKALPLYHPDHPDVEVPGCITVMIVADSPEMPPQPSQAQLEAVCRFLETKRLLTTELKVAAPKFRRVRIEATVAASPFAAFDDVKRRVVAALTDFLSPLPPKVTTPPGSAPAPRGSDFGLDLHPTRLYETILQVADVRSVDRFDLYVDDQLQASVSEPVTVQADTLLYSTGDHDIHVVPYEDR